MTATRASSASSRRPLFNQPNLKKLIKRGAALDQRLTCPKSCTAAAVFAVADGKWVKCVCDYCDYPFKFPQSS